MAQTKGLPPRPNLEHLKKQAKERLKKLRASNRAAKLADAQLALAREYGFASWKKLIAYAIANSSDGAELIRATTTGEFETVRKLLDRSPKLIAAKDEHGMTALHAAVCAQFKPLTKDHEKIVALLLDRGAEIEALAEEGNIGRCTPLHLACFSGQDRTEVVRRLIAAGAKVNVTSSQGDTPLSSASRHQEIEIAQILLQAGATLTLHDAVAMDMTGAVTEILDSDPTLIKQVDRSWGYTAVSCAQTLEMKEFLLKRGAQPGIHESAFAGLTERVGELLDANPQLIHTRENRGRQPLHAAIAGDQLDAIKLLVARGADLYAEWIEGWTPLVLAELRAGNEVVNFIREAIGAVVPAEFLVTAGLFAAFAQEECRGRSPLYERLSNSIADDDELLSIAMNGKAPIPNLFLGAVHYLLKHEPSAELARFYPSIHPGGDTSDDPFPAFKRFCLTHREKLIDLMRTRFVQTNEVARSGYLLPAFRFAWELAGSKQLVLIEIGTSAGLNLCFDHYAHHYEGDSRIYGNGKSPLHLKYQIRGNIRPPLDAQPEIARRIGIDLRPIAPSDSDAVAWLEALVWPEHIERLSRLRTGLSIAVNASHQLIAGDASLVLGNLLASIPEDQVACVFQTHSLNQFSPEAQARLAEVLNKFGAKHKLLFISRHNNLTFDYFDNGVRQTFLLAECDAHGNWIEWKYRGKAVDEKLPKLDLNALALRLMREMKSGWAESCAIIEQRHDDRGSATRWEETGLESPTMRERDADEFIIGRKQLGQYRMISVCGTVTIHSNRYITMPTKARPTRSLEFLRAGDPAEKEFHGIWRRIDWKPTNQNFRGKPARWDDVTEALTYLRDHVPPGEYRIITIRRMLFAEQLKDRIKIDKKHANLTTLTRVEQSVSHAKEEWSVESLPEHRKTHKIVQWKPIMDASSCGDWRRVKILLDAGADPNAVSTTPQKYRPLHRVIEHKKTMPKTEGHEQVVKLLLERGADPKIRGTRDRITALQLAAIGEPRFIPLLRDRFEPLDIFHAAVLADEQRVSQLLNKDPSLAKALDENNWMTLHYCAASILHRESQKTSDALVRIAKMLLAAGADPMASWDWNDQWPLRPLFYACGRSNNPAIARILLEAGADPCDGETVYHASDEGHAACLAVIEELTDPKKLAKECTKCLSTQLHWGHTRGTKWLLEHGADPNWVHLERNKSALQEAIRNKRNRKIIELLQSYSKSPKLRPGRRGPRGRRPARRTRE